MKLLELCLSSELNLTIKQELLKLMSNDIKLDHCGCEIAQNLEQLYVYVRYIVPKDII